MKTPPRDQDPLRRFASHVASTLRLGGFEALFAGGCVRDQLLKRAPKDFDIATSARPAAVQKIFHEKGTYTIPIGEAFGVICVIDRDAGFQVEVATFRSDGAYLDGRRPVNVTFSTAEEDARRRDFTINGLFFDPRDEQIIDYVAGEQDLELGIVRAIGDPKARLAEDKLRMLRAIRFTATLEFELEAKTGEAIERMAHSLRTISAERITGEMRLMLTDRQRVAGLTMLEKFGLLPMLFPENTRLPREDDWNELLGIERELVDPSLPLALVPLLGRLTDAEGAKKIAQSWRLSGRESARIAWLVAHRDALHGARKKSWPEVQRLLVHEGSGDLVELLSAEVACNLADEADLAFCRERIGWSAEQLNPPALITGDDLAGHGIEPGKVYQQLLGAVRDAQLSGQIKNRNEALAMVDRLIREPQ
jgi:tRNA nucleotidyltransferase/poly(A) polymerase